MGGRAQPVPIGAATVDRPGRADPARRQPHRADPDPLPLRLLPRRSAGRQPRPALRPPRPLCPRCQRGRRARRSTGAWRSGWPWRWTRCRRASRPRAAQSSNSPSNTANTAPCGSPIAANRPAGTVIGRTSTLPPSSPAFATESSTRADGEVGHPVRRDAGLHLRLRPDAAVRPVAVVDHGVRHAAALHVLEGPSEQLAVEAFARSTSVVASSFHVSAPGTFTSSAPMLLARLPHGQNRAGRIGDHGHAARVEHVEGLHDARCRRAPSPSPRSRPTSSTVT